MAVRSNREETISLILTILSDIDSEAYEDEDLASSSSSDDENELKEVERLSEKTPKVEGYVEEIVSRFSPRTFKSHFRMSPETFNVVENMISEKLINKCSRGRQTLEPRKQILMTLWLTVTPESYRSVSDRFNVSKATLWFTCKKVWEAISSLSGQFICFPSGDELEANASSFKKACGFPDVIGCIDGSHIPIKAPTNHPESYINRKGFHSILLQAVVDSRCRFIDCYAGEVGSVHDARVFRRSKLGRSLSTMFPPKYHLLGDSAYPLQEQLITPFRDNGHLSPQQLNFNLKHSRTRNTVERAFGLLKGRFRRLRYVDMGNPYLIPMFIMACCVLHNICLFYDGDLQDETVIENDNPSECIPDSSSLCARAQNKRNILMQML